MAKLIFNFSRTCSKLLYYQGSASSPMLLKANSLNADFTWDFTKVQRLFFSSNRMNKYGSQSDKQKPKESKLPDEGVFYHPRHDMYVCWHPEVPFPYEMSKPIPMDAPATESSLNVQALVPVREVFRKKDKRLMIRELMKMTYTAKYKWLGKHGRKLKYVRKDMDPLKAKRDREYL